jgi:hypothetical protein
MHFICDISNNIILLKALVQAAWDVKWHRTVVVLDIRVLVLVLRTIAISLEYGMMQTEQNIEWYRMKCVRPPCYLYCTIAECGDLPVRVDWRAWSDD